MILMTMLFGAVLGTVIGLVGWLAFGIGLTGAFLLYLSGALGGAAIGVFIRLAQPGHRANEATGIRGTA